MRCPSSVARTKYQAAMSARIFRVVLNYVAMCNGLPDFHSAYHSRQPQHLPQRMGQKKHFLLRGSFDLVQNLSMPAHEGILS